MLGNCIRIHSRYYILRSAWRDFGLALFLLVLLFMHLGTSTSAFAQKGIGQYRVITLNPFEYYYAGHDEAYLDRYDRELRKLLPQMQQRLGQPLPAKLRIDLPLSKAEFAWLTKGKAPEWAGGIAYPEKRRVVVKAPTFFEQGVSAQVLTIHELSHILMYDATKGQGLPRWFEEGIAQMTAGEDRSGSITRLARAAFADRLMGLPRVDDVLSFSAPDADLAYTESRAAAASFIDQFGWEAVPTLFERISKQEEFPDAFLVVTGIEYDNWQATWLERAQEKYKRYLFLNVDDLVWMAIVLLALAATFAVWLRKRRQFKKWLAEEEEEDGAPPVEEDPSNPA